MEQNILKIPSPKYRSGETVGVVVKSFYNTSVKAVRKGIIIDTHIHITRGGDIVVTYNVAIPHSGAHGYREEEINTIPTLEEYE